MEMWGTLGEGDSEFALLPSMAHAYVAQKEDPSLDAYRLNLEESGEIRVIDGPVQISRGAVLYGNRLRPIRATIARSLFAFAAGWSIPSAITSPFALFLIVACILCIVRIDKWEQKALHDAVMDGTRFIMMVGEITGKRGEIAALRKLTGSKGDGNAE